MNHDSNDNTVDDNATGDTLTGAPSNASAPSNPSAPSNVTGTSEEGPAGVSYRFYKRSHLRYQRDFDRVYSAKSGYNDGKLLVFADLNDLGYPRLGLSVSRKVGNAVKRNRWKRVLREAFRLFQHELGEEIWGKVPAARQSEFSREQVSGIDLVVIPRASDRPILKVIQKSLRYCIKRAVIKRLGLEPVKKSKSDN